MQQDGTSLSYCLMKPRNSFKFGKTFLLPHIYPSFSPAKTAQKYSNVLS